MHKCRLDRRIFRTHLDWQKHMLTHGESYKKRCQPTCDGKVKS